MSRRLLLAGQTSGGGGITFFINDEAYIADENMTWAEWVNSTYNINELEFINNQLYLGGMSYVNVSPNEVIIANYNYESYSLEPV